MVHGARLGNNNDIQNELKMILTSSLADFNLRIELSYHLI